MPKFHFTWEATLYANLPIPIAITLEDVSTEEELMDGNEMDGDSDQGDDTCDDQYRPVQTPGCSDEEMDGSTCDDSSVVDDKILKRAPIKGYHIIY